MATRRWYRLAWPGSYLIVSIVLVGCDQPPTAADIETKLGEVVQFGNGITNFNESDGSSETSMLVNLASSLKVAAYNSEDHAHVYYGATSRLVYPGASLMGWSTASLAIGSTFSRNRVPADTLNGFPILWGDPGLGQTYDGSGYMFLANDAAVQSKMPANGQPVSDMGTVMGGACIAKSTDGGRTFNLNPADCVSSANKDFYDGTAVTGTVANGDVYAAFENIVTFKIDVWRASSPTGHFSLTPNPFPGKVMCDHARLATDGQSGFVLAPDCSGNMWLGCLNAGSLCTLGGPWPMLVGTGYTNTNHGVVINIGVTVRRGAQYDIAINKVNLMLGQWADVIYGKVGANGQTTFQEAACHLFGGAPSGCSLRGFVDQGAGNNVFNPALTVSDYKPFGGSEQVIYQASWSQQVSDGVQVYSGVMSGPNGGTAQIQGRSETGSTGVCADQRGYWGDYNNHVAIDQAYQAAKPQFWTAFSDSTDNGDQFQCSHVNAFNSVSLNTTSTWITYP